MQRPDCENNWAAIHQSGSGGYMAGNRTSITSAREMRRTGEIETCD